MTWKTEQTETDQIQKNCGNISELFQEIALQSYLENSGSAPRAKVALNAKDAHTKCWFDLVIRS